MIVHKTKESAEEARISDGHGAEDMVVKVPGGYTIMSVREYIDWLVKQ